jgi:predicted amidohydrolase
MADPGDRPSEPAVPDRVVVSALPFDVRPGDVASNLEVVLDGVERAAAAGARLLLLPEKWTTSFVPETGEELRRASDAALATVHDRASACGLTVVGSALGGRGVRPTNEQHLLGESGDLRPYAKRMLFSPMDEASQCAAGEGLPVVVPTPVGRLAAVICYDVRFPELTRPAFHGQADLLVVPAEWPRPRHQVLELLVRARAVENQCWVLCCNRAGSFQHGGKQVEFPGTALLADPQGREVARTDDGELLVAEIDHELTRRARALIPCAEDLARAGLHPESSGGAGALLSP